MVHLKIVLDTRRKKSDGTYPINFRVTNVKKVHLIPSGISVIEADWDTSKLNLKTTHPNSGTINVNLSKRFYEIQKAILQVEEEGPFSFEYLKYKLSPKLPEPVKTTTFLEFANNVVDGFMLVKRTGNALVYKTAINRLMEYANNPKLEFKHIDYTFLDGFKSTLIQQGLRKNSIGNYLRSIRALYNKAIKTKIISRDLYPFGDITISTEKTAKRAISINDLSKIYNYPKKINSQIWHAANYFFLSFTLRGISFTDMAYLKKDNIHNGYLSYRRRKTKKLYTIRLHPVANRILSSYGNNSSTDYLLPIFPQGMIEDGEIAKKITRQWIKTTNKYLNQIASGCNIGNNITTYVIRHCWATIAKRLGFSYELISEGMGHGYGNKITNIYLDDFDQNLIDDMNDKIIISIIPCPKVVRNSYKFTLRPSNDLKNFKRQETGISLYPNQDKIK